MALPTESREIKDFTLATAFALLTKVLVQEVDDSTKHVTGQQILNLVAANLTKSDVGLGNVDDVQQQPISTLLTDIADLFGTLAKGDILVYNGSDFIRLARGADGEVLISEAAQPTGLKWGAAGGGGSGVNLTWAYDATTVEADPGAGVFRLNSATIASATELYVSTDDANGILAANLLTALTNGDRLYLQRPGVSSEALLVRVTGVTDNTTWAKITFVVEDAGSAGSWSDTENFGILLMFSSGGGGTGHTIVDENGVSLPARTKLAVDPESMSAEDDSANDQTIISTRVLRGIVAGDCAMATITGGWTPPTGGDDIIPWNNAPQEGDGNFTLGTGAKYTASEKGRYLGIATISFDGGSGADDTAEIRVFKNGSPYTSIAINPENFSRVGREFVQDICFGIDLEVGDYVQIIIYGRSLSESWGITANQSSQWVMAKIANDLSFVAQKLPSRVEVDSSDGASVPNDASPHAVVFTNTDSDADLLYNPSTGEYTAQVDTLLDVKCALRTAAFSWSTGDTLYLLLQSNISGVWTSELLMDYDAFDSGVVRQSAVQGSGTIFLPAGKSLRIAAQNGRTGGAITFETSGTCWLRVTAMPIAIPTPDIPAERIVCKVGIAGTQGIAHAAEEKVLLDTAIKDPKEWFNAGSNRIDILADGTFDFFGQLSFVGSATSEYQTQTRLRLRKNGTDILAVYDEGADITGYNGRFGRIEAREIDLVAGDYLEVLVYIWDSTGTGDRNIETDQTQTWFLLSESISNMAIRGAGVGTVLNAPVVAWPNQALSLAGGWAETFLDYRGIVRGNADGAWDKSSGIYKPKHDGWMIASMSMINEASISWNQDGGRFSVQSSSDGGLTWSAGTQQIAYVQPYSPTSSRWAFFNGSGLIYVRKDRWYRFNLAKEGTGGPIRNVTETTVALSPVMTGESTAHLPTWIPYTPTINWTSGFGTVKGRYKDLGDELEVEVLIPITGAILPASTQLVVGLPGGFNLDFLNGGSPDFGDYVFGQVAMDTGGGTYYGFVANDAGTLVDVKPVVLNASSTYAVANGIEHDTPFTFANGDTINLRFKVPVKRA